MPWNGSDEAVVVVDEDDERFEVLRVAFFCVPPLVFLVALPDLFAFLDLSFFLFFPCCCCCVFVFRIDVLPAFFRCSFACQYFLIEASFEEKNIGERNKVFGKINPKDIRVGRQEEKSGKTVAGGGLLTVRFGRNFAICDQRLPKLLWASSMIRASSVVKGASLILRNVHGCVELRARAVVPIFSISIQFNSD
jgi:hypothetical protein